MAAVNKGMRLHIGIFGRRNVGKSSLLNSLTHQNVSIVSDVAGTTTDPVEKPMELLPLGSVLFIDTAGIDDDSILGEQRVLKTKSCFDRTELALLVTSEGHIGEYEELIINEFKKRSIPVIVVFNKSDISTPPKLVTDRFNSDKQIFVNTSVKYNTGIKELRQSIIDCTPDSFVNTPAILGDLVNPGEMAILVVPIDKEAPKGRLIMPQVQSIRDLLDNDSCCMVVKERELKTALEMLKRPPKLVVTDSQAFLKVAADTPKEIPMTSFSILFSRFKGDLLTQVRGTLAIDKLKPGDKVLVAEACAHHPIGEDIGRVKIPRWLTQYVGGKLEFTTVQGHDFPPNLEDYKLVIHCGACMHNRREMLSRLLHCSEKGVPVTNYGLAIAYSLGIFERALSPFPAALAAYMKEKK
ncbi:MAG: [FeFe] hydrogenase H-cluster maturation GTPase HydF [Fibrobacteres bacterium]|nr:[FeFe] hydrogenase H-cluster maturation GTPase HydF [Fibrobacterota bacterium]